MQKLILFYFLTINLLSFLTFAFDKFKSMRKGSTRVSEKRLHLLSLLGGVLGSTLSMTIFRHKVSKKSFLIKHILIFTIWVVGGFLYFTQVDELNFLK